MQTTYYASSQLMGKAVQSHNTDELARSRNVDVPVMGRNQHYYDVPKQDDKPADRSSKNLNLLPIGFSLWITQGGTNDVLRTMIWRIMWFVYFTILFCCQFVLYEVGLLPFRMTFYILLFAMFYLLAGIIHTSTKSKDSSALTRIVQFLYVLALTFSVASSIYYIFLLFMDDLNRKNPRNDNIYQILSDGWTSFPYIRTGDLDDPTTKIEFSHPDNLMRIVRNPQRYAFVWFLHLHCHILVPIVMIVPLFVENTRLYYSDVIFSEFWTVVYTLWLWWGQRRIYNNDKNTPCVGSFFPYCDADKINPEYKVIYWKWNFFQAGETTSYLLLYYLMVYMVFYMSRAVSKRFARSATLHYNINPQIQAASAVEIQNFNQVPDEESQRNRYNDGALSPKPMFDEPNLVTLTN